MPIPYAPDANLTKPDPASTGWHKSDFAPKKSPIASAGGQFKTGFWIAAGAIVATWAAIVVSFIVMLILGALFAGLSGLGSLSLDPTKPSSQATCTGVDPNTGLIDPDC